METERNFSIALSIIKQYKKSPSLDDFVCEVTFGGWVYLLARENRCADVDLNSVQVGQKEQVMTIKNFWSDNVNNIF
ncbi:hypothetical protein ACWKWF_15815, partial [Acinetobacter kookii]